MACILFLIAVGRRQGEGVLGLFINGFIVLIVANVPQGLPATITSLQLIVAERLATQNVSHGNVVGEGGPLTLPSFPGCALSGGPDLSPLICFVFSVCEALGRR